MNKRKSEEDFNIHINKKKNSLNCIFSDNKIVITIKQKTK